MIDSINVAVATNTIFYAPFFLALYGGDFEKTPYGKLQVNIINQKENTSFNFENNLSINADGFVTMALLFGYADIGICDPSFIVQLVHSNNLSLLKTTFDSFVGLLKSTEVERFKNKMKSLRQNDGWNYKLIEDFIKSKSIKTIGGMIRLNPYMLISLTDKELTDNNSKLPSGSIISSFQEPSTGYYYGKTVCKSAGYELNQVEFGKEFDALFAEETDAIYTFDYVAVAHHKDKIKVIKEISGNDAGGLLFTAIIAETEQRKEESKFYYNLRKKKLKAFSYAIEKNLYQVSQIIKNNTTNDLTTYFKDKIFKHSFFDYKKFIKFVTSDKETRDSINNTNFKKKSEEIIERYTSYLVKASSLRYGLYYETSIVYERDFERISQYRIKQDKIGEINFKNFINNEYIIEWQKLQKNANKHLDKFYYYIFLNKGMSIVFSTLFLIASLFSLIINMFKITLLDYKVVFKFNKTDNTFSYINQSNSNIAIIALVVIPLMVGIFIYFNIRFSQIEKFREYFFKRK